jgi:hypothetical protein
MSSSNALAGRDVDVDAYRFTRSFESLNLVLEGEVRDEADVRRGRLGPASDVDIVDVDDADRDEVGVVVLLRGNVILSHIAI